MILLRMFLTMHLDRAQSLSVANQCLLSNVSIAVFVLTVTASFDHFFFAFVMRATLP